MGAVVGSELYLYSSETGAGPAAVSVPGPGTSLAFARSDRSWHEVMVVSAQAPQPRRAVLVTGYRPALAAADRMNQGEVN